MEVVFNWTAHKALWNWLAQPENAMKDKHDWPEWGYNGGDVDIVVDSNCFACDYTDKLLRMGPCVLCPLDWGERDCIGHHGMGLFGRWHDEEISSQRAKLAAQIRDLPVKPRVKCI